MIQFIVARHLGLTIGTLVHELGHLVVARLLGMRIARFTIGEGRLLVRARFGRTRVEWRAVPCVGFVEPYPNAAVGRLGEIGYCLAGVGANALLIVACAWLDAAGMIGRSADWYIGPIVFSQAYLVVGNLIPFTTSNGASDGKQILETSRRPRAVPSGRALWDAVHAETVRRYVEPTPALPPRSAADDRVLADIVRSFVAVDPVVRGQIVEDLEAEIAAGGVSRALELVAADLLATEALLSERPDADALAGHLARLDRLDPGSQTVAGTRGSLLVRLGRHEAGRELLLPLAEATDPTDRALSNLFLVLAEHALAIGVPDQRLRAAEEAIRSAYPAGHPVSRLLDETSRRPAGGGAAAPP